ncbi:MAG: hypothetical protein KJ808_07940 [Acidobacteria bacterium]|nr:hypothetical protein [Acidobacteriota bacterium]MBU4306215.1 hypothetical protein [Acidobacteriota bacterium]
MPLAAQGPVKFIDSDTLQKVKAELLQKYGESEKFRIERGVSQVADLWRATDGSIKEFTAFCSENFVADGAALEAFFKKLEFYSEALGGHFNEMSLDKDQPVDLDWGEITPIDIAMNGYNPAAHVSEDLFQSKLAFISLLNFPVYSLQEKDGLGVNWNRRQWAYARMGGSNTTRLPAEVNQKISAKMAAAGRYISEYNIYMGSLLDPNLNTMFPADMKLLSHWGLRDELKACYADKQGGLVRQHAIYRVMERIIRQEIPEVMINSGRFQWNPFSNYVYDQGKPVETVPEPDTRYKIFLDTFQAMRLVDPYSPLYPDHIRRSFDVNREIPEKEVEAMFHQLLTSPQVRKVAALIRQRLGRKLQPFDIWYPGLRTGSSVPEEELDKIVREKYPDAAAFEKDLPDILIRFGFSPERAAYISSKIQVDAARGSGHNAQAQSKKFKSRLRTRIPAGGMNYKGFNIALHEFGHAVENVLDLYLIDYYSLAGVPNNAFTEAFAFIFQERDLEILGIPEIDPRQKELKVLDTFWNAYEIMGVSLVDMKAWHWLYDHPQATPAQLREAVVAIAREIWNQYFAPFFGKRDQVILAVYSHMIDYTLYLPHYALGNVIQFQLEDYLRDKVLGPEMERMCLAGNIMPQQWMKNAVGSEISVRPMLKAVDRALKIANK